ncbi:MAG: hypothetical protein JO006_04470 [Paucibacter sp.]|nr:hypothetical protein [Roseateles sp.]
MNRHIALPLLPALLVALLTGCAHDDPHHAARQQAQERADQLALSGYRAEQDQSLTVALQQWVVAGQVQPLALAFPGSGTRLPLVVYLPGLGESAQAGSRWREAWARAGYAVLSVQPLAFDAEAWQSELARNADFKALARNHRAPELQPRRNERVALVLAEARRRGASGDSLWSRVDFDTVVMAGYDIGSLSAAEASNSARALLLLSPMPLGAELSGHLQQPMLMIGSRRDDDLIGLVASPAERLQGFATLPPGHKQMLVLDDANHALLSGAAGQLDGDDGASAVATPQEARSSHSAHGNGSRDGGGGGARQRRGGGGSGGDAPGYGGAGRGADRSRGDFNGAARAQVQAIVTLSTAFLDAEVRGSRSAREWLDHEAAGWVHGLGQWQQR